VRDKSAEALLHSVRFFGKRWNDDHESLSSQSPPAVCLAQDCTELRLCTNRARDARRSHARSDELEGIEGNDSDSEWSEWSEWSKGSEGYPGSCGVQGSGVLRDSGTQAAHR
jgi:hypothetical protein